MRYKTKSKLQPKTDTTPSINSPERGSFPLDHFGMSRRSDAPFPTLPGTVYSIAQSKQWEDESMVADAGHGLDTGECKSIMTQYLRCIRAHRGTNDEECRQMSKAYLQCRMERYVQPASPKPLHDPFRHAQCHKKQTLLQQD